MKRFLMRKRAMFFALILLAPHICFGVVESVFTLNQVVTASQVVDANGNQVIQASVGTYVGPLSSNPTSWKLTTISAGISPSNNSNPIIYATAAGDIIVAWTYLDSSLVPQVAAAFLRNGTSTWHSSSVTHTLGSNTYGDLALTGNVAGNILLSWTAFDSTTNTNHIYGATLSLSTSNHWNTPFIIMN